MDKGYALLLRQVAGGTALARKSQRDKLSENDGDYVELLKKGVDKGAGLMRLGKMLGCQPNDIYAAGDGYNDVEMLSAAAKGFVPENGSPEALAVADYVTRSNNDGCIAHAIEILDSIY